MYLLLFVLTLFGTYPASASDLYLNLGIGAALHQKTVDNGTWYQEGIGPYRFGLTSLAGKAGLGIRLDPDWAIEANILSLGQTRSSYWAVGDDEYNPKTHQCHTTCSPRAFSAKDKVNLVEVAALRSWHVWGMDPFVKAGAFLGVHDLNFVGTSPNSEGQANKYSGYFPGAVIGGGVCYRWACAETSYYAGIGSTGYPIARNILVPMFTVKIPL